MLKSPTFRYGTGSTMRAVGTPLEQGARVGGQLAVRSGVERKIGTPEAQQAAAARLTEATGEEPADKDDLAKKYFLADGGF